MMDPKLKHKNMRHMAWSCLFAAFAYVLVMVFVPEVREGFGVFLGFCGSVILAYFTNSNIRDGWGKQ